MNDHSCINHPSSIATLGVTHHNPKGLRVATNQQLVLRLVLVHQSNRFCFLPTRSMFIFFCWVLSAPTSSIPQGVFNPPRLTAGSPHASSRGPALWRRCLARRSQFGFFGPGFGFGSQRPPEKTLQPVVSFNGIPFRFSHVHAQNPKKYCGRFSNVDQGLINPSHYKV